MQQNRHAALLLRDDVVLVKRWSRRFYFERNTSKHNNSSTMELSTFIPFASLLTAYENEHVNSMILDPFTAAWSSLHLNNTKVIIQKKNSSITGQLLFAFKWGVALFCCVSRFTRMKICKYLIFPIAPFSVNIRAQFFNKHSFVLHLWRQKFVFIITITR